MATYYLRADGTDTADGTRDVSAATDPTHGAWKSLSRVATATLSADDQVLLRCGDTFRGDGVSATGALTSGYSGTSGHPITFTSYGSGAKPILKGSLPMTGWAQNGTYPNIYQVACVTAPTAVWVNGASPGIAPILTTVAALNTAATGFLWLSSVLYYYSPGGVSATVEAGFLTNTAKTAGKNYLVFSNLAFSQGGNATGAAFSVGSGGANAGTVTVSNCDFKDSACQHIGTGGNFDGQILIDHCTFDWSGAAGVSSQGSAIQTSSVSTGSGGVSHTPTTTVQYCTFSHVGCQNTLGSAGNFLAHGIYHQQGTLIWRCNKHINGNAPAGTLNAVSTGACVKLSGVTSQHANNIPRNCQVYSNLFQDGDTGQTWGMAIETGTGHSIYNNTFYRVGTGIYFGAVIVSSTTVSLTATNNIFYSNAGSYMRLNSATTNWTLAANNNCYYGGYTSGPFYWQPTASTVSLATWDANWHAATGGTLDATVITSNPQFIQAGQDFRLQRTSPCVGVGANMGLTHDMAGMPVPSALGISLGAYEPFLATSHKLSAPISLSL